ncbi:MAG: helix-hairpin-helix domain-containing protein, partial [Candidatus Saccharibacteria bacterium]|nr:helix-hairpin-helix domain-containing protein [Candidatus Saccharibacteria bacterium]
GPAIYKANLRKLISYIKGNRKAIAAELERDMKTAAGLHDFERAADLRNKLRAMQELQRRVCFGDKEFLDISKDKALADLAKLLGLKDIPARIEGYDISHMSGRQVVSSMVVFTNGVSDRAEYRKFKVSEKNDDTGNIYQTIFRRLSERHLKGWGRPDLLLIDGGKGQLVAAIRARDERGVTVPIVSIAKREEELLVHKTGSQINTAFIKQIRSQSSSDITIHEDGDVYIVNLHPNQRNAGSHSKNLRAADDSLVMSAQVQVSNSDNINTLFASTDIIKLFQRIRDESHRFAVSYHSTLKRKNATKSILDDIYGIGPKTKRKLLRHFGSLGNIKKASIEDISKITNDSLAKKIKNSLRDT